MRIYRVLQRFVDDELGADMAEYALVLVLIVVVAFVAVQGVGAEVACAFNKIIAGLSNRSPTC